MAFYCGVTGFSEKKETTKRKIRLKSSAVNIKQAREGLNALLGVAREKEECSVSNFANELNVYYSRFDCVVPVCDCVKPKKATGPDGPQAHVLKDPIKGSLYKVIPVLVKHTHSA